MRAELQKSKQSTSLKTLNIREVNKCAYTEGSVNVEGIELHAFTVNEEQRYISPICGGGEIRNLQLLIKNAVYIAKVAW